MHIDDREHKVEGNQVKYWNGLKWLVRETLSTKKDAEKLLDEVKLRKDAKR
mgnify:CR=1 FL=1